MFNFTITKERCYISNSELLEKFTCKDLKKGIAKACKRMQEYINNGTVNDYTTFATCEMQCKKGIYTVSHGKLIKE